MKCPNLELLIDQLAERCGYFSSESPVGNYYNCLHPNQEERELDEDSGEEIGKCLRCSCPIAYEKENSEDVMVVTCKSLIRKLHPEGEV